MCTYGGYTEVSGWGTTFTGFSRMKGAVGSTWYYLVPPGYAQNLPLMAQTQYRYGPAPFSGGNKAWNIGRRQKSSCGNMTLSLESLRLLRKLWRGQQGWWTYNFVNELAIVLKMAGFMLQIFHHRK